MTRPLLRKYPEEVKSIEFEFVGKLAVGDALTGAGSVSGSAGLTLGTPTVDPATASVTVTVSGGTLGSTYEVRCEVDTAGGEHLKLVALVEVSGDAN